MTSPNLYLGLDLGTSSIKAVLINHSGQVVRTAIQLLTIQHPQPRFAEQNPEDWWKATENAIEEVLNSTEIDPQQVKAIGLSGQQHGAVLLDKEGQVLRPAILWNDGRSDEECVELEKVEGFREVTGNLAMPGFTAPKLMWVRKHEPEIFKRISKVLLPKDYLRFRLTGSYLTDASDAAGTLWLDVRLREWSNQMLHATGLTQKQMPEVREGSEKAGELKDELTKRWNLPLKLPIAAGGGDNAAGAVGVGIVKEGHAMLSLGTSGVYFVVADEFKAKPDQAVHSFCHALPGQWHLMSVMLNSANCLDFTARLCGFQDVSALLKEAEERGLQQNGPLFLPYLSGERTPHNDAHLRGSFTGLGPKTDRADLANATLEGVGLGLLDGFLAVESAGCHADEITVIGGGSRSDYWTQMLSDILGRRLVLRTGGEVGPALGAARLARLCVDGPNANIEKVCPMPSIRAIREPNMEKHEYFRKIRHPLFKQAHQQLRPLYSGELNGKE